MHSPIYYINGGCAMNKKLITIFLLAALLIVSLGVISAADNDKSQSISVSIKWNDNGHSNARPDSVVVNLIKNDNIIENKTLNKENSWSATFNVDGDGSYSVSEDAPSNYSVSKSGSVSRGFVITNTYKADVLSAKENDKPLNNTETAELIGDENNTGENDTVIENNTDTNSSDENNTKTTDNETVDNTTPPQYDGDTVQELEISSKIEKSKEVKKDVKKEDKEKKKPPKPKNVTQNPLKNTGIPAVILVVAVFVAAFIPYRRNK